MSAVDIHYSPQEVTLAHSEFALGTLHCQVSSFDPIEDLANVAKMFVKGLREDDDVVEIDEATLPLYSG
jgi:hypothetical protein